MAPVQPKVIGKEFEEVSTTFGLVSARIQLATTQLGDAADDFKNKAVVLVRDPQFQTCTLATTTGAVTFGTAGGAFGLASGVVAGSVAGVVPALLTFGMSIPAGAVIGGSGGLFSGILIGGSAGGLSGYEVYKYRVELKRGVVSVKVKALGAIHGVKDNAMLVAVGAHGKVLETVGLAKLKAAQAVDRATSTRAGVTSTAAAAGAVVGGVTGGAAGALVGAAVGVVPAIFTFGLSIPVAATAGLCLGSAAGGSAGAVGGGAAGYGGFTYRKEIAKGAQMVWSKAKATAASVKGTTTCGDES
jgi:hypothetical protein